MEPYYDKILDSPSKNSYIGSYYQPPDRLLPLPRELDFSSIPSTSSDPKIPRTKSNIDSKAVVNALKNLQDKIKLLGQERVQAERSYQHFLHDAQRKEHQMKESSMVTNQQADRWLGAGSSEGNELDSKLQSAEARCKTLEKQLDSMRKMVERAKKQSDSLIDSQKQQQSTSDTQIHHDKLEKLELECLKLSRTQMTAEWKLAILEQKLQQEEQERKRVQEKADELQRELDINLRLPMATDEELMPKKKNVKMTTKPIGPGSPCDTPCKKMPFVAGTSLSPSHSVHANVQSILHMMKHHQPQLCERVSAMQKSGCRAKKSLQTSFCPPSTGHQRSGSPSGSLSDLLLALQDELGQMSFEQQELQRQMELAQHEEEKQELREESERLVARMEEKGVQITKLRKHQRTVHKLTQSAEQHRAKKSVGTKPPSPSPVRTKQGARKNGSVHNNNLQLLRETQRFRNSLKQDDVFWET